MSTSSEQQQHPNKNCNISPNKTVNPRTPSPGLTFCESMTTGDNEVPSPIPASVSSTASCSEHSSLQHSSSNGSMVPNPFAPAPMAPAPAVPHSWSHAPAYSHPSSHGHHTHAYSYPHQPPPPPHGYSTQHPPPPTYYAHHPHHSHPIPMVVSAPGPATTTTAPPPGTAFHAPPPVMQVAPTHSNTWAQRHESCPNFSIGTSDSTSTTTNSSSSSSAAKKSSSKTGNSKSKTPANSGRRRYNKTTTGSETGNPSDAAGETVVQRRQKRLERNRESARLSRRRRKQYLEILEERVTQLSTEVDQGRRVHAAQAITVLDQKRRQVLEGNDSACRNDEDRIRLLEFGLHRTSPEMMLVHTFQYQQLRSFALPPQTKFILWLTLQSDQYFRGGRAASERLSAARIGERVSLSGICSWICFVVTQESMCL